MTDEPTPAAETPDEDETTQPDGTEPDGGDEDATSDVPPVAEPPPVRTQADIEKRMRALDNEATRHAKRVAEIMEEDFAMLVPSPIDWTPGFVFNPEVMPLSDEQVAALDALLGRAGQDAYPVDESRERCETCDGFGMLRTGSRVQNQEALACRKCMGQGWVEKLTQQTNVTQLPPPPVIATGATQHVATNFGPDAYGRPWGNPRYGQDPQAVGW